MAKFGLAQQFHKAGRIFKTLDFIGVASIFFLYDLQFRLYVRQVDAQLSHSVLTVQVEKEGGAKEGDTEKEADEEGALQTVLSAARKWALRARGLALHSSREGAIGFFVRM